MKLVQKQKRHSVIFLKKETKEIITKQFPNFQDDNGQFDAPEFHLARRNLKKDAKKHGKITANAFEIQVAKEDARLLRCVLEVAFGLQSNQSNYLFVPYSLLSDNLAVYAQLLGKQNNSMQNQCNVSLAGVTNALMTHIPTKAKRAIREILQDQPGAVRIAPTWQILDLGKWNISTDSKHYLARF